MAKVILKRKNRVGRFVEPNFKTYKGILAKHHDIGEKTNTYGNGTK